MSLGDLGTSRSGVRREDISIDMPGKILRESQRGNDIADTAPFFFETMSPHTNPNHVCRCWFAEGSCGDWWRGLRHDRDADGKKPSHPLVSMAAN